MAELLNGFLTALLWPIPHILTTLRLSGTETATKRSIPIADVVTHVATVGAALRSFTIAVGLVYGLYDGDDYPAFGRAYTWSIDWMWPILVRNLIGTWLICGFWDYWLYFGPLKDKLFKYKIVQKYPSMVQMRHDMFYTTLASCFAALLEIVMCHCWATGVFPMARSLNDKPFLHLILALATTHGRLPHFYLMHRVMHPWRTDYIPDIGKFLYRHVHSLHHKSYNITAFSGTNMHPIEATLYYTAALLSIPLGVHPTIAIAVMVDCAMGAWIGHDGHVYPGAGDYYHTLHHLHFDCNYGNPHIPFDWFWGTYIGCKEDLKKVWGNKKAGLEGNDTYVHSDSKTTHVE